MVGAIDDPLAIRRIESAAVITKFASQTFYVGAVAIHGVKIEIPIPHGGEYNPFPIGRKCALSVVASCVCNLFHVRSLGLSCEDVIGRVKRPAISFRPVWRRRA